MNRRTFAAFALAASVSALATLPALAQDINFRVNVPGNQDGIAFRSVEHFNEVLKDKSGGSLGTKLFHSSDAVFDPRHGHNRNADHRRRT